MGFEDDAGYRFEPTNTPLIMTVTYDSLPYQIPDGMAVFEAFPDVRETARFDIFSGMGGLALARTNRRI